MSQTVIRDEAGRICGVEENWDEFITCPCCGRKIGVVVLSAPAPNWNAKVVAFTCVNCLPERLDELMKTKPEEAERWQEAKKWLEEKP